MIIYAIAIVQAPKGLVDCQLTNGFIKDINIVKQTVEDLRLKFKGKYISLLNFNISNYGEMHQINLNSDNVGTNNIDDFICLFNVRLGELTEWPKHTKTTPQKCR